MQSASLDTEDAVRDQHVRESPDFFDVANHPEISFASTRIEDRGNGRIAIAGELQIRGVSREIELDGTSRPLPSRAGEPDLIELRLGCEIDRREFGLTWNQKLDTGGAMLGNRVKIELEIVRGRRSRAPSRPRGHRALLHNPYTAPHLALAFAAHDGARNTSPSPDRKAHTEHAHIQQAEGDDRRRHARRRRRRLRHRRCGRGSVHHQHDDDAGHHVDDAEHDSTTPNTTTTPGTHHAAEHRDRQEPLPEHGLGQPGQQIGRLQRPRPRRILGSCLRRSRAGRNAQ